MKKFVKLSLTLAIAVMALTGCNCYKKMAKNLDLVEVTCTPEVLVLNNGKVNATVDVKFPSDYFHKDAVVKLTPVMVYEGGEVAGTPVFYQGSAVEDNYKVIVNGATESFEFDYTSEMRLSALQLRVEIKCDCKSCEEFDLVNANTGALISDSEKATLAADPTSAESLAILKACGYEVAIGVNTMQQDFSFGFGQPEGANGAAPSVGGAPSADGFTMANMPSNYKRVTNSVDKADLLYTISSSYVAPKASKSADVEEFKATVDANSKNDRATQKLSAQGYASPDGPEKFNDKLSKSRSESGQKAMEKLLKDYGLTIDAASYGEDWEGFKELVQESNIEDKNLILQVLSLYSSSTQREDEIKNMSAVFSELKTEVLPQLRRTQMVNSVDLVGKSDEEMMALVASKSYGELTVLEMLHICNNVAKSSDDKLALLETAVKESNNPAAYNNLGVIYAMLDRYDDAKRSFDTAAKNGAPAQYINKNMALLCLMQGDVEGAAQFSSNADPKTKAAVAAAQGDYTQAAASFTGYNKAVACVMTGDYSTAKRAIAEDKSADADYLRAVIASIEGDVKVSGTQLTSAVDKDPSLAQKAKTDVNLVNLFESGFEL